MMILKQDRLMAATSCIPPYGRILAVVETVGIWHTY